MSIKTGAKVLFYTTKKVAGKERTYQQMGTMLQYGDLECKILLGKSSVLIPTARVKEAV